MKLIIPGSLSQQSDKSLIATNYNRPSDNSITLIISKSMVPIYQQKVNLNPDYFRDAGIRWVRIVSDEDYATIARKYQERRQTVSHSDFIKTETKGQLVIDAKNLTDLSLPTS